MIDLSSRLASGDILYGTFLGLGSALAAEACALAGFDWLLTDLEHGGGDESELLPQQLAADGHGVPMLVRVESTENSDVSVAMGAGGAAGGSARVGVRCARLIPRPCSLRELPP